MLFKQGTPHYHFTLSPSIYVVDAAFCTNFPVFFFFLKSICIFTFLFKFLEMSLSFYSNSSLGSFMVALIFFNFQEVFPVTKYYFSCGIFIFSGKHYLYFILLRMLLICSWIFLSHFVFSLLSSLFWVPFSFPIFWGGLNILC